MNPNFHLITLLISVMVLAGCNAPWNPMATEHARLTILVGSEPPGAGWSHDEQLEKIVETVVGRYGGIARPRPEAEPAE